MNSKYIIGTIIFGVFVIAQFFKPQLNTGNLQSLNAFLEETKPTTEVKTILETACLDCHSNSTRYPWYNKITPINFWLASHINEGKKHFNMSKWTGNSIKRKDHKFEELQEMIIKHDMPLPSYTWAHSKAKLTQAQRDALLEWAKYVRYSYMLQAKPE